MVENVIVIILLAVLSNLVWLYLAYVRPFIYVLKTGRFLRGFFVSWCYNFLFSIMITLIIPGVIGSFLPDHKLDVYDYFPDGPAIFAILVTGWMPALIFCGIAFGIHCWIKERRKPKTETTFTPPLDFQ